MRHLFQIVGSFLIFTFFVSMRLRCDRIFNDQFITKSLPSPRVKNFENQSTFSKGMDN